MVLKEILYQHQNNSKIAMKSEGRTIEYKNLFNKSKELAEVLNNIYEASAHISIYLPNSIEYAISYFAIAFCDKTIIPIHTSSTKNEVLYTLHYCDSNVVITNNEFLKNIEEFLLDFSYKFFIINIDNKDIICLNKKDNPFIQSILSENMTSDEKIAIMLQTSGTTSKPKRVMLSHRNLSSNIISNIESWQLQTTDITLMQLPMNFSYCNTAQFLTHLYLGATIVLMNNVFTPRRFFHLVNDECITNFVTVPPYLQLLAGSYNRNNISTLKKVFFGGGSMPVDKLKHLMHYFPTIKFIQTYGQTEAAPRITTVPEDYIYKKIGSVGKPIPNIELQIVNLLDKDVNYGEIGEIKIRGDNIMKGYYKRPEETKEVIREGWLYTGDLGFLDSDGFIYLVGRKRNIIICGGCNVHPEEIEEVLLRYPNVKEVCVEAAFDSLLGEIPIAKVVLHRCCHINETEIALKKFCYSQLSGYKIPKKFIFVDEIKKTMSGKTIRY